MKILLIGKGKSIESIKKYLKHLQIEYIQAVFEHEYEKKYLLADENLMNLTDIDYAIKSPGISETNRIYQKIKDKFNFICELDLLYIFKEKIKVIAITGSNGKTTCVNMINCLLNNSNLKTIVCGNSHNPITSYYKQFAKLDYLIVELSSFQLHNLKYYQPFISTILNLQPNHLDNVYSLKSYYESKKNIYKYLNKEHYFILNPEINELNNLDCFANVINLLHYNLANINDDLKKYVLQINICYTILKILNIDEKNMIHLNKFKQLPFREEKHLINDTVFINDSKSTSLDATLFAISHLKSPQNTILIIGGKDKQISFKRLENHKLNNIICYGEIQKKIQTQLKNVIFTKDLSSALLIALLINLKNKTILFSPAASSFDQYKDYITRGKYFNKLIRKYGKKYA